MSANEGKPGSENASTSSTWPFLQPAEFSAKSATPPALQPFTPPNISTGLDDSHVVLLLPKDPVQIGEVVVDGNLQPIWVDPKELIPTPEQKLEQADNMKGVVLAAGLAKACLEVGAHAEAWLDRCLRSLCPCFDKGQEAVVEWLKVEGISYVEDNSQRGVVRFVLLRGDKVLSEFVCELKGGQASRVANN